MVEEASKKQMLLASAENLIAKDGYENLSIRKLAVEAQVSIGYLYNYFSNKEALFDALIEHFYYKHLHETICTLDIKRPFIEYVENLFNILSVTYVDRYIHDAIHNHYKDHFKKGLTSVLENDLTIDDAVWGAVSKKALVQFVTDHLLYEVSLPQPQFEVFKTMLLKTLYKGEEL